MMNNHSTRMLCVLGASALLMGAAAIHQIQLPDAAGSPDAAEVLSAEPLSPSLPPAYLVREVDGLVAVFTGDGAELLQLTNSPVAALPASDRACLSEGIPVPDDRALAMLLEDYQ